MGTSRSPRKIRAEFDDHAITVYQAYSPAIADAALAAGTFVSPFKRERMTWIKPSFLWMMYRCGWATKSGQERVLAISITRSGFEWALANSSLSSYDPAVYSTFKDWLERKESTCVRVQWDPERSLLLQPQSIRAIQIGLGGEAVRKYVDEWIIGITDLTQRVRQIHDLVVVGNRTEAMKHLPVERTYPICDTIRSTIGAD